MKPTTDELIKRHKAYRIKQDGTFTKKVFYWNLPLDLINLSKCDCYRFDTFIGFGSWIAKPSKKNAFVCIAKKGEVVYLNRNSLELIVKLFKLQEKEEIAKIKEVLKE